MPERNQEERSPEEQDVVGGMSEDQDMEEFEAEEDEEEEEEEEAE